MTSTRLLLITTCILISPPAAAETYDAVIDWAKRIEIGPLVSGTVAEVNAEIGDFVKQGTTLLQIDSTPYETVVKMRDSQLASAAATRDKAKDELDRQQELYDIGSLSTVDLDKAVFDFTQAESVYQQASAALKLAELELAHTMLMAPFDAWVVKQHTVNGQKVNAEMQVPVLFVIAQANAYAANATIPNSVLPMLKAGQSTTVVIGDRSYSGNVVTSVPATMGESVITVHFETDEESLLPGTPVKIEIE